MRRRTCRQVACILASAWAAAPVLAEVTLTGDTKDSGTISVGVTDNSSGQLRIDGGSVLSRTWGIVGYGARATGTAIVAGDGSQWINSGLLMVGLHGTGIVRVEAGGQLNDASALLGCFPGSSGTLVVTGAGSRWSSMNSRGSLSQTIGDAGDGTLRVEAGGQVTSEGWAHIAAGSSSGQVTITGTDSTWTCPGIFVGGNGRLRVEAGGQVKTYGPANVSGTVAVNGAGSKWITDLFTIGPSGNGSGSVCVEAGGEIISDGGVIGNSVAVPSSLGRLSVSGPGSKFTCIGGMNVIPGNGSLAVSDGGVVMTQLLDASSNDLHGNGTILVDSRARLDGDWIVAGTEGSVQGLRFGNGGVLQLSDRGSLWIGNRHSGSLRIDKGCSVASMIGVLGYGTGTTGSVTVTGEGSKWINSGYFYVGFSEGGSGAVTISDGGQVVADVFKIENDRCIVRMHVTRDNMLVLGRSAERGSIINENDGRFELLADAFLPAGTYRPVGERHDRPVIWLGRGVSASVGGRWDIDAQTFNVLAPKAVIAGTPAFVESGQRLLVTDPLSGSQVGVSLGVIVARRALTAVVMSNSQRESLVPLLGDHEKILDGWYFTGDLAGGEALVSFEVGPNGEDLHLWRLSQSGWSAYRPEMMTHGERGIVSFTIDPAFLNSGGFAVSQVPEPGTVGLGAVAGAMLLGGRRVRRRVGG